MNNSINNLSPLDGRYSKKVSEITELFSEKALIQKRFIIEIEWLLFVLNESFYKTIKIISFLCFKSALGVSGRSLVIFIIFKLIDY